MKDSPRIVTFSPHSLSSSTEGTSKDVATDQGGTASSSMKHEGQQKQPESPTNRSGPSRTTSGKFEDPMLVWKSSQSDGALCPSPSAAAHPSSPTHAASGGGKLFTLGGHPQCSPTSSSKNLNFRAIETLLDSVPCSSPSPHSPAPLASPIRSQSPTPLSARAPSSGATGSNSNTPSISPSSMFERLQVNTSYSHSSSRPAVLSEGGMRTSPHSKSLNFSGGEETSMSDRSYSYTFSSTGDPSGMLQLPTDIIGPSSAGSPGMHRPPVSRLSFNRSSSIPSVDAAAAAAVAAAESDRSSGGGAGADASLRNLSKMKSIGGRSMGGRALNINPCWRSGGALTLNSATSGALPEGGLQSQTHEALQQLLAATAVGEPSPNKRFSAPGQALNGAAPAQGFGGASLVAAPPTSNSRRVSRDFSTAVSLGNALLPHAERDMEDKDAGEGGGSGWGAGNVTPPTRGRRFSRSLTEKLDERLALSKAVELSYNETAEGIDDDVF